jgi:hypothetical protein
MFMAVSFQPRIELYMPSNHDNLSSIYLTVLIRDRYDAITQVNVTSVTIESDWSTIEAFIQTIPIFNRTYSSTNQTFVRLLTTINQNKINQLVVSHLQQFNRINWQTIETSAQCQLSSSSLLTNITKRSSSILDGLPAIAIGITSLDGTRYPSVTSRFSSSRVHRC